MKHSARLYFDPSRSHSMKALKKLAAVWSNIEVDVEAEAVFSDDEGALRALYERAKGAGFRCSLVVTAKYDVSDALSGKFGLVGLGPAGTTQFRASLPKDAFDFSSACPRCGIGATRVKPHVLSERAIRASANFYYGAEGSLIPLMRAKIGREIVEATGQPECMRHPVRRDGRVVKEWMEPFPTATLGPLSPKSEGVHFGRTEAFGSAGDPPQTVDPCEECGTGIWDYNREQRPRLVYSRAAIRAIKGHAVVQMREPQDCFPEWDPAKGTFKSLYGLPHLLFTGAALEVLAKYVKTEPLRDSMFIEPVFSE